MTRCNGRDPAYPGLLCYLPDPHGEFPCEFTDAVGEVWRQRALDAEAAMMRGKTDMPTYPSKIVLGHEYRVKTLKLRGIADSVHFFRNACERVVLQYMHDGDIKEASFDAVDLEDITPVEERQDEPEFAVAKPGGPARTMPKRR